MCIARKKHFFHPKKISSKRYSRCHSGDRLLEKYLWKKKKPQISSYTHSIKRVNNDPKK